MTANAIKSATKAIKNAPPELDQPPRRIGYARVSTEGQNLDLQISALERAGCHSIFADHGVSGMKLRRPEFDKAMTELQVGDTLVVWKLDRMSRSLRHLVDVMEDLRLRGCQFECITDAIDTSTAMGQFTFHIMAAMAELERTLISERTIAGLAAARARGQRLGRPKKVHRHSIRRNARPMRPAIARQFTRVAAYALLSCPVTDHPSSR